MLNSQGPFRILLTKEADVTPTQLPKDASGKSPHQLRTPIWARLTTKVVTMLVLAAAILAGGAVPASAWDAGGYGGWDGNPVNCTGNYPVGPAVPVKARDGRIVGYSQMWWSNSCRGNWTRAWTVSGQPTTIESTIFQSTPPSPTRRFAIANDYSAIHFTMYIRSAANERMCSSSQMWDTRTLNWAFSGVYCRS